MWCLSGGFALDLFVGRPTRPHEDIDVSILREEATVLTHILPGWDLHLAHQGVLTPWAGGPIEPPSNSLWCRPTPDSPWQLQIMLESHREDRWVCRRHPDLTLPLADVILQTPDGVPLMAPEVQLFMKAKDTRPKDDDDFALVSPLLPPRQAHWLALNLDRYYHGHHWLRP
jgi:hypothetical protein